MILLGFVNVISGYPVQDVLYICNLRLVGVKPLIHRSELGTYTKVGPFQEQFLSLCSVVKTTKWNGLIKIDN